MTGKQLEDEFIKFGDIVCCCIRYDEDNKHLGYGYVQFETSEDAEKAQQALDGKDLEGSVLTVAKFIPKQKRPSTIQWRKNLFFKQFPQEWDYARVEKFVNEDVAAFGTVSSVSIRFNDKFQNHVANVCFENLEDANKAKEEFNDKEIEGATLYCNTHESKTIRRKTLGEKFAKTTNDTNLFIKSIKIEVTPEQLITVFAKYGEIASSSLKKSAKVPKAFADKGEELQFGFISYKESASAAKAFA